MIVTAVKYSVVLKRHGQWAIFIQALTACAKWHERLFVASDELFELHHVRHWSLAAGIRQVSATVTS